jgi:hypothetical protein
VFGVGKKIFLLLLIQRNLTCLVFLLGSFQLFSDLEIFKFGLVLGIWFDVVNYAGDQSRQRRLNSLQQVLFVE